MARTTRRGTNPALHEAVRSTGDRARVSAALVVAGALLLLPSCASVFPTGPTPVAQGKYYGSGDPEYDTFFIELHRTQVSVGALPGRVSNARNALTDGLGVSRQLSDAAIVDNVRARAQDLSKQGVVMKLKLEQNAVLLTRPQERGPAVRQLAEPVEKASNDLLTVSRELDETQKLLDRLEQRRNDLDARVDHAFGPDGPVKVNEVERNLADAEQVIVVMRERTGEHQKQTKGLLDGLLQATDTSRGVFDRPAPPPAEAPRETRPKRGGGRSASPSRATKAPKASAEPSAPKSAPKSPPKAPAASDGGFEP